MKPEAAAYHLHSIVDPRWHESLDVTPTTGVARIHRSVSTSTTHGRSTGAGFVLRHATGQRAARSRVEAACVRDAGARRRSAAPNGDNGPRAPYAVQVCTRRSAGRPADPEGLASRGSGRSSRSNPESDDAPRLLVFEVASALCDLPAPNVLSDRRYKDCAALHYGYGAFKARRVLGVKGTYTHLLTSRRDCGTRSPAHVPEPAGVG